MPTRTTLTAAGVLGTLCIIGCLAAPPPAAPKVSSFAPSEDLAEQVEFYVARLSEALASLEGYGNTQKSQVIEDAGTLAVLGLALGLSDQEHPLKKSSRALIEAAQSLAGSFDDYNKSIDALQRVKKAVAGEGTASRAPLDWETVAPRARLMKQAHRIELGLKRDLDPPRFAEHAKQNAELAATWAVLGQSILVDTHGFKKPADLDQWSQYAAEMRDSAAQLNVALHAGDRVAASQALLRASKSCNACHEEIRTPAHPLGSYSR